MLWIKCINLTNAKSLRSVKVLTTANSFLYTVSYLNDPDIILTCFMRFTQILETINYLNT